MRQALIERLLADYFRSESWEIVGDYAVKNVEDEYGLTLDKVIINLSSLAKDIDRDFDFIGAAK